MKDKRANTKMAEEVFKKEKKVDKAPTRSSEGDVIVKMSSLPVVGSS